MTFKKGISRICYLAFLLIPFFTQPYLIEGVQFPRILLLASLLSAYFLLRKKVYILSSSTLKLSIIAFSCFLLYQLCNSAFQAVNFSASIQALTFSILFVVLLVFFFLNQKNLNQSNTFNTLLIGNTLSLGYLAYELSFQLLNNGIDIYEVSSFFVHKNTLSAFLFLCTVVACLKLLKTIRAKLFSATLILLNFLAILFLQSRAVLLAFALFALLATTLFIKKKGIRKFAYFSIAGLPIAVYILYRIFPNISITSFDSLEERFKVWSKTLIMIKENLWFGVGKGNWQFNYMKFSVNDIYMVHQSKSSFQNPHNEFLQILAEQGVVGTLFFLTSIFFLTRYLSKKQFSKSQKVAFFGLLSTLPIAIFSFPFKQVGFLFIFSFLLVYVISDLEKSETNNHSFSLKPRAILIGSTLFLVIISSSIVHGERNTKKLLFFQSQNAYSNCLKSAINAESYFYNTDLHSTPIATYKGWCYQKLGNFDSMLRETKRAVKVSPYNFSILSNYGYALMKNYQYEEAEEALLRSYRINRYHDATKYNLCILYYNQKNYWEAFKWIREIPGYEIEFYSELNKIVNKLSFPYLFLPTPTGSTSTETTAAKTSEASAS